MNLKGPKKLAALEEYQRNLGVERWDYVGDDHSDLCIWKAASACYVVGRKRSVLKHAEAVCTPTAVFRPKGSIGRAAIKALRPHQWMKNTLVFIPVITSHKIMEYKALLLSALAFVCFSACASSIYITNDLLDLDADRLHPRKNRRPFASGVLPIAFGPPLSAFLFLTAMTLSLLSLDPLFPAILLLYVVLSTVYSSYLKAKPIIDVVVLAMLYTLRIFAGSAATGIPISAWLMAFSLFLFSSLAFAKRHTELRRLLNENRTSADGRGYLVADFGLLESMGTATGSLAVLVLALYINSPETRILYRHPLCLWLVCPLLLFWVGRLWLLALRGRLDEDPLMFAMTDRVSLTVATLTASIAAIGTLNW